MRKGKVKGKGKAFGQVMLGLVYLLLAAVRLVVYARVTTEL